MRYLGWSLLALFFALLTLAAIFRFVPAWSFGAAERFAAFGEFACWATVGGVFSGCPRNLLGLAIWIVGNALFWIGACALLWWLVKFARTRLSS